MTLPSLTHYEIRYSGNGLKQSVFSGQIHQQVSFHSPRRAMIGRERTNSDGGVQVAVPVTNPSQGANILSIYAIDLIETMLTSWTDLQIVSAIYYFPQDILSLYLTSLSSLILKMKYKDFLAQKKTRPEAIRQISSLGYHLLIRSICN
jgi:hypothetical protein